MHRLYDALSCAEHLDLFLDLRMAHSSTTVSSTQRALVLSGLVWCARSVVPLGVVGGPPLDASAVPTAIPFAPPICGCTRGGSSCVLCVCVVWDNVHNPNYEINRHRLKHIVTLTAGETACRYGCW